MPCETSDLTLTKNPLQRFYLIKNVLFLYTDIIIHIYDIINVIFISIKIIQENGSFAKQSLNFYLFIYWSK